MKVKLAITGMHCDQCSSTIESALKSVPGLQSCHVEIGAAEITFNELQARTSDFVAAIQAAGTFGIERFETVT